MADDLILDGYTSSSSGITFLASEPSVKIPPNAYRGVALQEDTRPFSTAIYGMEVHSPVPLFSTEDWLSTPFPRCLDMPLRLRGEATYSVPDEWVALEPLIRQVAAIEHATNPSVVDDYFTYMTVDCSTITEGETQRRGGAHVDGFQGARIDPKTKVTRNYVATSNGGTIFYPQLFDASWDDARYNIFEGFQAQVHAMELAPENKVIFMDAYTVHEAGAASRDGLRVFFRMTYDCKKFDRLGNTHNAMLPYSWPMVTRDVQATLETPPA